MYANSIWLDLDINVKSSFLHFIDANETANCWNIQQTEILF